MKKTILAILLLALAAASGPASAYEVATHEEMSARAAARSVLGRGSLLNDIDAGTLDSRYNGRTLREWIRYGANHEDDWSSPRFPRFVNHFYNPLTGTGLTGSRFPDVLPSPLWGLEDTRTIPRQTFSLRDAVDAFYASLTLPIRANRDQSLAQTFRTVGHVVHLVQDAAQPQHTRNDSHGTGSAYERHTDQMRVRGTLPYDGYPSSSSNVKLDRARSYWHTVHPPSTAGQGLAEFSNRNFVSIDTNYRYVGRVIRTHPRFPQPTPDAPVEKTVTEALSDYPTCTLPASDLLPLRGTMTFYPNLVTDSYIQPGIQETNIYGSTLSLLDADLEQATGQRLFTLNRFNYCAAQQYLIPRAVSYSAGLIDYFFRGKLDATFADQGGLITIDVRNASGYSLTNGRFELFYEATDGTRKPLFATNDQVDAAGMPDGSNRTLTANTPVDVDQNTQKPFILVFRGTIGTEEGIAAKALSKNVAEERIYLFGPLYGEGRVRVLEKSGSLVAEYFIPAGDVGDIAGGDVDSTHIYRVTHFTIQTISKSGVLVSEFPLAEESGDRNGGELFKTDGTDFYLRKNFSEVMQVYSKTGALLREFPIPGTFIEGFAVDATNIYIGAGFGGTPSIRVYTKTGTLVSEFPLVFEFSTAVAIAVDNDNVYVADLRNRVQVYTKTGRFVTAFGDSETFNGLAGIAVDANYIYTLDFQRLLVHTKAGVFVRAINPDPNPLPEPAETLNQGFVGFALK